MENIEIYKDVDQKLDNCMLYSNAWVFFNYLGRPAAYPPTTIERINAKIDNGSRIVVFTYLTDPPYSTNKTFLKQFPVIEESNHYLILGKKEVCAGPINVDTPLTENINNCEVFNFPIICK